MRPVLGVLVAALVAAPLLARAEPQLVPVVRASAGPAFHFAPAQTATPQFALDATVGATWVPGFGWEKSGLIVGVEAGYAFDGLGLHAFALAPSIGYGNAGIAYVAYQPRLLVGSGLGDAAVGMRNGVGLHVLGDVFALEVGYQFASYGGALQHSMQLMLSVNPGALVYYRLAP